MKGQSTYFSLPYRNQILILLYPGFHWQFVKGYKLHFPFISIQVWDIYVFRFVLFFSVLFCFVFFCFNKICKITYLWSWDKIMFPTYISLEHGPRYLYSLVNRTFFLEQLLLLGAVYPWSQSEGIELCRLSISYIELLPAMLALVSSHFR